MITIEDSSSPFTTKNILFARTQPSGRVTSNYVEAKKADIKYDEPAYINIPATGDIQLQDVPEFIEAVKLAVKLAVKIASGDLKID